MLSLIFFSLASFASPGSLEQALKEHGVSVDSGVAYKILKDQHLSGSVKKQHEIVAESPAGVVLEIKIIEPLDPKAGAALVFSELGGIKKVYAPPQTPYMGDIAQAIGGCPSQFQPLNVPVTVAKAHGEALVAAATADRAFGACSETDAKLKAAFFIYYDADAKAVWSWRIFTPWTGQKKKVSGDWLQPLLNRFKK